MKKIFYLIFFFLALSVCNGEKQTAYVGKYSVTFDTNDTDIQFSAQRVYELLGYRMYPTYKHFTLKYHDDDFFYMNVSYWAGYYFHNYVEVPRDFQKGSSNIELGLYPDFTIKAYGFMYRFTYEAYVRYSEDSEEIDKKDLKQFVITKPKWGGGIVEMSFLAGIWDAEY